MQLVTHTDVADEFQMYLAPGHLIRRVQQVHNAVFDEVVSDPDLTPPQFAVLSVLYCNPNIDQVELAQRLGMDRSTIADLAGRLEDRRLIKRTRDKNDQRRKVLRLTKAGESMYLETLPEVIEVGRRIVEPLDERERGSFLTSLAKIITSFEPPYALWFDIPVAPAIDDAKTVHTPATRKGRTHARRGTSARR
jgi:DNA-binding MarR family transcriptional regulator